MLPWLLLFLTVVFAALAIDAYSLAEPSHTTPYSITANALGQDVSHVPLSEQERRKEWNKRFGVGNPNQSVWLFAILALGSAVGAVLTFLT
jgi:hypothetical protein